MGDAHITTGIPRATQPFSTAAALAPGNQAETCSALKTADKLINRQTLMICNTGVGAQILLLQKRRHESKKKIKNIGTCT